MSEFSLDDALSGQSNTSGLQSQGQNWNNPWGAQNPQNPGQQYPGGIQGQAYPGYPGPPAAGQQYPGPPAAGQQYPGQPYAGFPGFPPAGQTYPGAPMPGQPGPAGPVPSAPTGPLNVPYNLQLPSGLVPRLLITFQGSVSPNAKRFCVDFKTAGDIAFHFNPRFDENPNVIVRNSMIRNDWGREERQARFPFLKGQPFTIQFFFELDKFNVTVNNENICQFQHRVKEFAQIKNVCIGGDITLTGATATVV